MILECEKCHAELSAGDISIDPASVTGADLKYHVVCHECDHVQPFEVTEQNGMFTVIVRQLL